MFNDLLLAIHSSNPAPTGKGMSFPWAIVIFLMVIGLALTLSPPRRTSEIKRNKDE